MFFLMKIIDFIDFTLSTSHENIVKILIFCLTHAKYL